MSRILRNAVVAVSVHAPYRLRDGWYVIVDGSRFGPWAERGYAQAGLEVETRRAEARRARQDLHIQGAGTC